MKTNNLTKNQIDLIKILAENYNVVLIFNPEIDLGFEVYVCQEFREADSSNNFHSIRRFVEITGIIDSNSTYVNSQNSLGVILSTIDKREVITRTRKFSGDFSWILY